MPFLSSISFISWWPVHLSMLSWSSFNQCSAHYSFQATGCLPKEPVLEQWTMVREEWILSQWLQSILRTNIGRAMGLSSSSLTHSHLLTPLGNKPFENTVGKGEIACNEQFLLFPQCFLPISFIFVKSEIVVCKLFQFGRVYNLSSGNGLNGSVFQSSEKLWFIYLVVKELTSQLQFETAYNLVI